MSRRTPFLVALFAVVMLLMGCTVQSVDEMYAPPKRSEAYNNLQSAIDEAMAGLSYCAPHSGEHQQAVQMADINGDKRKEYLLFAKSSEETPLRILVFAEKNGSYALTDTIECNGASFDQVEYIQMDGTGGMEMVVGCQLNDQVLRAVSVYSFSGGNAECLITVNYTKFLTADLSGDSSSELFVLRPGPADAEKGVAELYDMVSGRIERSNEVSMSQPVDQLKRVIVGKLYGGQAAVYAASAVGETEIVTDIFALIDDRLTNVSFSNESGTSMQTIRNYYVYADDIDNDGVVELPDLITMVQLNDQGYPEKQDVIRWYAMKANGAEVNKLYTYHNFVGGWYLQLESHWASSLTVQTQGNCYDFYFWDDAHNHARRVFTIYAFTGQNRDLQSTEDKRFLLCRMESVVYAATLDAAAAEYGINEDTLVNSFHLIQQDWKTGET